MTWNMYLTPPQLLTLTISPFRCSSNGLAKALATKWERRPTPLMTSQSLAGDCQKGLPIQSLTGWGIVNALLTSTSRPPFSLSTLLNSCSSCRSSALSHCKAMHSPPLSLMVCCTSSSDPRVSLPPFSVLPVMYTVAPLSARPIAMPRPMPLVAPVTTAVSPCSGRVDASHDAHLRRPKRVFSPADATPLAVRSTPMRLKSLLANIFRLGDPTASMQFRRLRLISDEFGSRGGPLSL
mmetsp:Transcript_33479/g.82923  ORF Transcript_33479/g.82923 Transcript_33479/m.82923 type:complete len:237 (+) Transcript_33479:1835-2545(+)